MNEDFSLTKNELELLNSMLGSKIYRLTSPKPPEGDEFWWPVTLVSDNHNITISNQLTVANYFDGTEDCGRLSVIAADVAETAVYEKNINQCVSDIKLVINTIKYSAQINHAAYSFVYPRALIFEFGSSCLLIERGWRFQEYLTINIQMLKNITLTDELPEWYDPDEDVVKPQLTQKIISIAKLM